MDLDPAVHRHIFVHGPPDPAAHRAELIRRIEAGWPERGGLWVAEWREQPGFLGWCGVFPLEDSGLIELGYRYVPDAWGRGVATEAARAVLNHAFGVPGFDPIVAVTHPENRASARVLAKLGFEPEGFRFHYGLDLPFFRLSRADWLGGRRALAGEAPPATP